MFQSQCLAPHTGAAPITGSLRCSGGGKLVSPASQQKGGAAGMAAIGLEEEEVLSESGAVRLGEEEEEASSCL